MTQNQSSGKQNQQSERDHESIQDEQQRESGHNPHKSSHDHMSRQRAGDHEGAGGGAKQKENRG